MLITPADVIAYSVFDAVKERPVSLLEQDILEAEIEIESIVGHNFAEIAPLPDKARLALLKMAQFYALINSDESIVKGYTSEKIGDYSYTLANGQTIRKPDVKSLLKEFIKTEPTDRFGVQMRLRVL
ncbi:DUF3199 family protein [Bacillus sp. PK3_68]|uniref:protein YqbG n=1 Tax=Bacillus sp. PK3_68 TaxID=2027408 RepID=UPI000E718D74|nr:DUF3199 family protein [Bacillus sp. PK3_68]RJS59151.1 hypothetical protein CJ483_02960 [Bacillus sp. PK3_68]